VISPCLPLLLFFISLCNKLYENGVGDSIQISHRRRRAWSLIRQLWKKCGGIMSGSLKDEWTIGRLLSTASGYWQPCALHAAVKLEIFTQLGERWLPADEIVRQLQGGERGVPALLNALTAMGLLLESEGKLANSGFSQTFLCKESPHYKGHIIMHHHHLVDAWAQLDRAVISDKPVRKRFHGEDQERESFQMGMFNLAVDIAPKAAAEIDLHGRSHLLDLGGGPGTYAIFFCLANPRLRATIFDRPTTRDFALKTAERFEVADRVDFVAGDFNKDPITGRYDAAWLSHILHSNSPRECERLIAKVAAALKPGGLIMVHEFFLNDNLNGPLFPALFSLNMLLNSERGRSYSEKEIRAMLERAGVKDIHRLPFNGPNDSYAIGGTV
jgi:SAM-dependent methyltransferase